MEILSGLIKESVRLRLISHVPLGAFLSGGIDSGTIVGSMSQSTNQPVQTFSIGFQEDTYNELPYAEAVAKYFGTKHRVEVLKSDHTDRTEQLVADFDEPFADTSVFPTFLVSKLASREVKVVLSGDGGDELFAGYDTYLAEKLDRHYIVEFALNLPAHMKLHRARTKSILRQAVKNLVPELVLEKPKEGLACR